LSPPLAQSAAQWWGPGWGLSQLSPAGQSGPYWGGPSVKSTRGRRAQCTWPGLLGSPSGGEAQCKKMDPQFGKAAVRVHSGVCLVCVFVGLGNT